MTPEQQIEALTDLRSTIEPKSDRINADDFFTGPRVVTIKAVHLIPREKSFSLELHEMKPYFPCKTVRKILIAAWGKNGNAFVGRRMMLYCDSRVRFGDKAIGGIRVSHLSGIEKPLDVLVTVTRAKRETVHIEPLKPEASYPDADFDKNLPSWVSALKEKKITWNALISRINEKAPLSPAQLQKLQETLK